ncbi:MAG: hypothetical protein U9N57_07530, partial [Pseudomonadota bacterium]|nr:hypothetical protein [Pseudomonadota bacterium]
TKTRAEAFGIPTKEDNGQAVKNVKYILETLRGVPNFILSTSESMPHFTLVSQAEMFTEDEKKIITQSLLNYQPDANNDFRNKGFSPVEMSLFDSFKQRYTAQDIPLKAEHLWQE